MRVVVAKSGTTRGVLWRVEIKTKSFNEVCAGVWVWMCVDVGVRTKNGLYNGIARADVILLTCQKE